MPTVDVSDEWRDRVASQIGELPLPRRARYIEQYSLNFKDADALTMDAPSGDLLDAAVAGGAEAKRCVNFMLGRGAALANERECTIAEIGLSVEQLTELAKMLAEDKVNATAGAKVFDKMIESGDMPSKIAEAEGLLIVRDTGQIEEWVNAAIANNPQAVEIIQSGGKKMEKSFGFLTGQVMQASKGAASAKEVQALLREKLAEK